MPGPFTWVPNVPTPTDLIRIFPTTPQYVSDKQTLAEVLGTLNPAGSSVTTGFRVYQYNDEYYFTFNCKTLDVNGWVITQDDVSMPSVIWYTAHGDNTVMAFVSAPPGSINLPDAIFWMTEDGNFVTKGIQWHRQGAYFGANDTAVVDGNGNAEFPNLQTSTISNLEKVWGYTTFMDHLGVEGPGIVYETIGPGHTHAFKWNGYNVEAWVDNNLVGIIPAAAGVLVEELNKEIETLKEKVAELEAKLA
jgi:hypothetical protein